MLAIELPHEKGAIGDTMAKKPISPGKANKSAKRKFPKTRGHVRHVPATGR